MPMGLFTQLLIELRISLGTALLSGSNWSQKDYRSGRFPLMCCRNSRIFKFEREYSESSHLENSVAETLGCHQVSQSLAVVAVEPPDRSRNIFGVDTVTTVANERPDRSRNIFQAEHAIRSGH